MTASSAAKKAPEPKPADIGDDERGTEVRLIRGASMFVGSGGLFYALLTFSTAVAQASLASPWWTPVAYCGIYGPAAAMVAAAVVSRLDLVKLAAVAFAAGYLFAVSSWFIVRTGDQIGNEQTLWTVWLPGLPALALCVFWRRMPFAYLVLVSVMTQISTLLVRVGYTSGGLPADILFAITYSSLPCAACIGLVRTGRMLDETSQEMLTRAAAAAGAAARRFERHRLDGLTHDGVLATLLQASRADNTPLLASYARSTLTDLDRLRGGAFVTGTLGVDRLIANIRAVASDIDDHVPLRVARRRDQEISFPHEVGTVLTAATGEALRNWKRHASPPDRDADCEVDILVDRAAIRIDVIDDGIGFDLAAVPADRLGLRASVTKRLESLPGGWSTIETGHGMGTRVSIGWSVDAG